MTTDAELVEHVEAAAWADYYRACPPALAAQLGVAVHDVGGATVLSAPALPMPLFNRALGLGIGHVATAAQLDEILAILGRDGFTGWRVQLSPAAMPEDLRGWLAVRGLSVANRWAKVLRDADPPPAVTSELAVDAVGPEDAEVFGRTVCAGFGLPPPLAAWSAAIVGRPGWTAYLARDAGTPVACAAIHRGSGETAWCGIAATVPGARRRGGQGALFARRIADGLAAGVRRFATETGEETASAPNPSFRNMLRAGFKVVSMRENWGS